MPRTARAKSRSVEEGRPHRTPMDSRGRFAAYSPAPVSRGALSEVFLFGFSALDSAARRNLDARLPL